MNGPISVGPANALSGTVNVPGDKSISHRALIFNAFSRGSAQVSGLLNSDDVTATARILSQLGTRFDGARLEGVGGHFQCPEDPLNCGNSGTTARLMLGLLAGQNFRSRLVGDESLSRRPMGRVTNHLREMGAAFSGDRERLPIVLQGDSLQNKTFRLSVASAQVKTALLLAGLQGEGVMEISEPLQSRDHTERMLAAMGVCFERSCSPEGVHTIRMRGRQRLQATDVVVPGDISSATFLIVAASIIPGSDIVVEGVGLNETRTGSLDVLRRMGANISVERFVESGGEPIGDLRVRHAELQGTRISGSEIPRLIDELPILAMAACHADGVTTVEDAAELRVKESDRLMETVRLCRLRGVEADEASDGFTVRGDGPGQKAAFEFTAVHDHRMAMAAVIAGMAGNGDTRVNAGNAISTSFPTFLDTLGDLHG